MRVVLVEKGVRELKGERMRRRNTPEPTLTYLHIVFCHVLA